MQCMQNLKLNYIDATSFTNLLLRNTLHFLLYFPRFFVARRLGVACYLQELCLCRSYQHSEMKRKTSFPFAFHSIFRNFAAIYAKMLR